LSRAVAAATAALSAPCHSSAPTHRTEGAPSTRPRRPSAPAPSVARGPRSPVRRARASPRGARPGSSMAHRTVLVASLTRSATVHRMGVSIAARPAAPRRGPLGLLISGHPGRRTHTVSTWPRSSALARVSFAGTAFVSRSQPARCGDAAERTTVDREVHRNGRKPAARTRPPRGTAHDSPVSPLPTAGPPGGGPGSARSRARRCAPRRRPHPGRRRPGANRDSSAHQRPPASRSV
jgi:hypothetical protein